MQFQGSSFPRPQPYVRHSPCVPSPLGQAKAWKGKQAFPRLKSRTKQASNFFINQFLLGQFRLLAVQLISSLCSVSSTSSLPIDKIYINGKKREKSKENTEKTAEGKGDVDIQRAPAALQSQLPHNHLNRLPIQWQCGQRSVVLDNRNHRKLDDAAIVHQTLFVLSQPQYPQRGSQWLSTARAIAVAATSRPYNLAIKPSKLLCIRPSHLLFLSYRILTIRR